MTDAGPQPVYPLQENAFPAADAPRDADVLLVPHHPRAPPWPQQHPVLVQQRVRAIEQQNAVFPPVNAAGNYGWVDDYRDGMPPPIENMAAQGQPQDPRNNVIEYHPMAHPPLPPAGFVVPYEYHGHDINHHAGVARGIPARAVVPPAPEIDIFDHADHRVPAGLAPAFVEELPHQAHVPIERATEVLRRLASRYLNQPDSQVDMVRIEPGLGGGIRVVITLELADLL